MDIGEQGGPLRRGDARGDWAPGGRLPAWGGIFVAVDRQDLREGGTRGLLVVWAVGGTDLLGGQGVACVVPDAVLAVHQCDNLQCSWPSTCETNGGNAPGCGTQTMQEQRVHGKRSGQLHLVRKEPSGASWVSQASLQRRGRAGWQPRWMAAFHWSRLTNGVAPPSTIGVKPRSRSCPRQPHPRARQQSSWKLPVERTKHVGSS